MSVLGSFFDAGQQLAKVSEAVITVGTVPSTDQNDQYETITDGTFYADYIVVNRYKYDPQTVMCSVASPTGFQGASVVFVRLGNPTLLWYADWTAKKVGNQPTAPDPTPQDPNWVFIDRLNEANNVDVMPDGQTPIYRLSGTYVYGHKNPPADPAELMNFGRPPWLDNSFPRDVALVPTAGQIID